ncbi:endoplasmic reticulum vesicle transporter-domain-containing protein [Umbelopsis sp. PMI_123]|nr:endoplasmic reticulum vesicle transporter-domain-containing protein [Umbelopsis sp. PMI_123]
MSLRKLSEKVSQLDAFPKVEEDNKHRSGHGGLLTLVLAFVLTLLTISEIADYRRLNTSFEFLVDHQVARKVQINLDMTIAMPCPDINVDVYDLGGERLHLTDNFKTIPAKFEVANARLYGQPQDPTHIHEIIKAAKGQRVDDGVARDMGACRVLGSFEVNKVAANLHITAQGHGYQTGVHTDHQVLNFTHRIDEFSFGKLYPNLVNPLDDSFEMSESHFQTFQYFMSVVPTTYIDNSHNVLETYQYAVTDSSKSFTEIEALYNIPGIFFKYDFEPISVRITEKRPSFTHFLVRLSGIIGGAVVCVGFAYRIVRFVVTGGKENPDIYAGVHNLMKSV